MAEITAGTTLPSWTYTVKREDLVAYANASGDANPIHQDEAFAKQVGLPDVIAHGMHTMARMGQFVTDWAGDPARVQRIKTRFTSMVVVPADGGCAVTCEGTVTEVLADGSLRLDLQAKNPDGSVAGAGEAIVSKA